MRRRSISPSSDISLTETYVVIEKDQSNSRHYDSDAMRRLTYSKNSSPDFYLTCRGKELIYLHRIVDKVAEFSNDYAT